MADTERPNLRIVAEDEKAPDLSTFRAQPLDSLKAFRDSAQATDAERPLLAAYLACAGCWLVEGALGIYHQAAAHAPVGVFRHDIPPGLRSAEATRAWLGSHIAELDAFARRRAPGSIEKYARAADLRCAAELAAEDVGRALDAAHVAGLHLEERAKVLFAEAAEDLAAARAFVEKQVLPAKETLLAGEQAVPLSDYLFGLDAVGELAIRGRGSMAL